MDTLPTEVLVKIFGYLKVGDILSCIKVCRRWNEILIDHDSLLSNKACIIRCTGKIIRAKQLWNMISKRRPTAVVLKDADPAVLKMLLRNHGSVQHLSVSTSVKEWGKVISRITSFRDLEEISLHIKGGSRLHRFQISCFSQLPLLRKITLTELGSVTAGGGLNSQITHLTFNYLSQPPEETFWRRLTHLECLEVKHVTNDSFSVLRQNFHNLRSVILTGVVAEDMEFPVSLITQLRIQGNVRGKLKLDKILDLQKVHLSLTSPLPECQLPGTVNELSLRDTRSHDAHWLLGLSIMCAHIYKLDLKGFSLKTTIAASLGTRFPKVTHLNIIGSLSRNVDHMYLIGLLQEATFLTTVSLDTPYSCQLHDIRQVFPHVWLSTIDYKFVEINSDLPTRQSDDVVIDMDSDNENPRI